ncbi:hypothetical protein LY71_102367 [Geodermatophilus tzadiensis]|uniref:Pyridoxamine 5'-phosphate oxidase n=1 Tax=Geodermatophilus tzadiensis TaxID=1137988 RepID=A0A2T0U057_9ACTN|nr:pyridoxamine 5'-phosphate oxidase [Geodermatophilus tzadiensis]PRY51300.1 hypothetical protein LY71_102367 [Geodermatophilus tzadiensis]
MDADLDLVRRLAAAEHGPAVVVAFVAPGRTRELTGLRRHGRLPLVLRHGWEWVAVEGDVDLAGPDDPGLGLTAEEQRLLLRRVLAAAGGTHDDLDEHDRVMAAERRTAVLVRCERVYTHPPHARHAER